MITPASRGWWGAAEGGRGMDSIVLEGGVEVSGAKNAALPLLFATLLTPERSVLRHVPALADIRTALAVLKHLGAEVAQAENGHEVAVQAGAIGCTEAPYE